MPASAGKSPSGGRGLRIALDKGLQSRPLNGAWWPRSRDLAIELAQLAEGFPKRWGVIERVLFSRPDWADTAGDLTEMETPRGALAVSSFPSDDTHVVILTLDSGERMRLLVLPFDTPPDIAESVMGRASDDGNLETANALLGIAGHDQGAVWEDVWNDEPGPPPQR